MRELKVGDKTKKVNNTYCDLGKVGDVRVVDEELIVHVESCGWERLSPTLDNLSVGDVVVDDCCADEYPVVAVLGHVIGLADSDGHFEGWYTVKELKDNDWSVKQPEEADDTVEVTLEEVAKLKNVPVGKLRIKKEAE